jgi:phage/plasmid-associated DNA primase
VSARWMRQDFFSFYPQFKLLFSGNHMPTLRVVNKAITRRFNRIPFNFTIPDDQVNKNLAAELKAQEGPGILAWAIEGCLKWQEEGMNPPKVVTDATEAYLESQDVIGEWLEDCFEPDAYGWVSSTDFFNSWQPWAEARQEWVGSVKRLSMKLEDRGLIKRRNKEQTQNGFAGWRLKKLSQQKEEPKKVLWMFIERDTPASNGHDGAILVALKHEDEPVWLPKSQIKQSETARADGRFEITMPKWLAEKNGLHKAESPPDEGPPDEREVPF